MSNPHKVHNMGDFLSCENPGCIWGATWSMGHICNHCRLHNCTCPCPLTKEWLEANKEIIAFRKIKELLAHEKAQELWWINHEFTEKKRRKTGKFYQQTIGKLELIEYLYNNVKELTE